MAKKKRRTRQALAGLCLAALTAISGAPLLAAEAEKASSIKANVNEQPAGVDVQGDEPDSVSLGGAIYSPFSTAFDTAAAQPSASARATPSSQKENEGTSGLVTTTIATFISAGLLFALVRVLTAS